MSTQVNLPEATPPVPAETLPVPEPPPAPIAKDKEAFLERQGLAEPAPPVPAAAPEPEPRILPAEEPKLLAGKYKTVEELEKAYKEAESRMHAQAQEVKTVVESVKNEPIAAAVPDAALGMPERPDPILDPEGYAKWVEDRADRRYETRSKVEDFRRKWEDENKDLKDLGGVVDRLAMGDPRAMQVKSFEDAVALYTEYTGYVRKFAQHYMDLGRKEASTKVNEASIAVTRSQTEQPPLPKATPASGVDDVDEELAARRKFLRQRRGY